MPLTIRISQAPADDELVDSRSPLKSGPPRWLVCATTNPATEIMEIPMKTAK
jgi:hypothetical protein